MLGEKLVQPIEKFPEESALTSQVLKIESLEDLHPQDRAEFDLIVDIVAQFSRVNPNSGRRQMISKGRLASIPAITQRHVELVSSARGQLTYDDLRLSWAENMPDNDGTRHPDLLFDIAQFNFGSDEPVADIFRVYTLASQERRAMRNHIRSHINRLATHYRNHRDLTDSTEDEEIDAYLDYADEQLL